MRFRRQVLSLLLALVMVLTLVPVSAFADEIGDAVALPSAVDLEIKPKGGETQTLESAPEATNGDAEEDTVPANDTETPDISAQTENTPEPQPTVQPVMVSFSCAEAVDLRSLRVTDAEGEAIEPVFDEESGEFHYGLYRLLPGTYSYSYQDAEGRFEALDGLVFTVDAEADAQEVVLALTPVELPEPAAVTVSFSCADLDDLSGLTLRDADGQELSPVYDPETETPVSGTYQLLPGEYSYSFHDENGKYKDFEDSLFVDGSEDLEIALHVSPVVKGMSFSGSFINPIYADVINESDLPEVAISPEESLARLEQTFAPSPSFAGRRTRRFLAAPAVPVYDNIEDAGSALKAEILKRNETITLRLVTELDPGETEEEQNETWTALCYYIYAEAIRHNGTPTEGDYIRYEYGGANFTGSILSPEDNGIYYYEFVYAPLYFTTLAQEKELDAKVNSILASLDLENHGDYDKMKAIYDYLCSHVSYDNSNSGNLRFTAYSALVNGRAVCQGYSVALYRLCLAAGIDTRIVTSESMVHAWNIVLIDGSKWYYVDSTWDAQEGSSGYKYFLKGTKNWASKHTAGDEFGELADIYGFDKYHVDENDYVAPGATIRRASVVFDGLIRIKYYFEYSQSLLNQRGAYVAFYQDGEEVSRAPLSAVKDSEGLCSQYFNVFVKDLSKDVTVRVFDAFGNPVPMKSKSGKDYTNGFTYSAMTYARQMQTSSENVYMRALAKALEDYGMAAQIYFKSGSYQNLSVSAAVKGVKASDLDKYAPKTSGTKPAGITKASISVMFEADNSLRIYFTYDGSKDQGAYTYTIDGKPAQILRRGDGSYYITYQNIAAQDLEIPHAFSVSDGVNTYTVTCSVLGYAQTAIKKGAEPVQNLGKALYLYNLAAEEYFSHK